MKRILTNGGSFSTGYRSYPDAESWPKFLAERTGHEVNNIALDGCGIQRVVRTTIQEILTSKKPYDAVVVVLPAVLYRREWVLKDATGTNRLFNIAVFNLDKQNLPKIIAKTLTLWYGTAANDVDDYLRMLIEVHHLVMFLKQQKLKFHVTSDIPLGFLRNTLEGPICPETLASIDALEAAVSNDVNLEWGMNSVVPDAFFDERHHPTPEGMVVFAEYLIAKGYV